MRFKPNNQTKPGCFMAGLYGRLSDEDRGKVNKFMESESIKNQRDYLHYTVKLINEAEDLYPVEIYDEYYDDDYTGITFERPNFQRMMQEVEAGRIDCIIVKDFSRFGRDYIRIIKYLEKDFERKNHEIRFVAYSDHYDSLTDKPDIGVRILLFLNEEYSRSQSHKVTTGMESMMRAGKFIGAFAPYGYRKDPLDKHHLLIDEEVCDYVREIYRMNLVEGLSAAGIAKVFNEKGILSPAVYKEKKGLQYRCSNRLITSSFWTADTINRILQDEKYTGSMVQHKTFTKDFKRKEVALVNKEDWIKVAHTHDAIISKDLYDRVQHLHKAVPKNKHKRGVAGLLSGVLRCGDCHYALVKHTEKYKDRVYHSYQCRTHKKDSTLCYANRIYENTLSEIILEDLNKIIAQVQDLKEAIVRYQSGSEHYNRIKALRYKTRQKQDEMKKLKAIREGADDKWLLGKLSDDEHEQMKARCQAELIHIETELLHLQKQLEELMDNTANQWIEALLEHKRVDNLSREMITEAIDVIYLYHDGRIEINYKFSDELKSLFDYLSEL